MLVEDFISPSDANENVKQSTMLWSEKLAALCCEQLMRVVSVKPFHDSIDAILFDWNVRPPHTPHTSQPSLFIVFVSRDC